MPRVLMIHTRELCYFSGSYFMAKISEAMEYLGIEISYIEVSEEDSDLDVLENLLNEHFDAIIDINSKLPYLELDDGVRFLDKFDCPFFNYIVDHPLYHYTGLSFLLRNYHVIGIDKKHVQFLTDYFSNLQSVSFLPMAGSQSINPISYCNKDIDVLFMGTYENIDEQYEFLIKQPKLEQQLVKWLIDKLEGKYSEHKNVPIERLIEQYLITNNQTLSDYNVDSIARLSNHCYLADKIVRSSKRLRILSELGKKGVQITVVGSGWENTSLSDYDNIKLRPPVDMAVSFEYIKRSKIFLDINPLFTNGLHDRVPSAMANYAVALSDMNPPEELGFIDHGNYVQYDSSNINELVNTINTLLKDTLLTENIAVSGYKHYCENFCWEVHAKKLIAIMQLKHD